MAVRTRTSPRRRDELIDGAIRTFIEKGVAATSVDDIVRAAGVAKGTFYLYFQSREDIVTAVAERLVEGVGSHMEAALTGDGRSAAERIRGIAGAMAGVGADAYERELVEALHEPGNAAIHDRLAGRIVARLLPAVTRVVEDGIATGEFERQDPGHAAAFVLACFSSLHQLVDDGGDLRRLAEDLNAFVLRGLGASTEASR